MWLESTETLRVLPLPEGTTRLDGSPVETVAVPTYDLVQLRAMVILYALDRDAQTVYVSEPHQRYLPLAFGPEPGMSGVEQSYCYVAYA